MNGDGEKKPVSPAPEEAVEEGGAREPEGEAQDADEARSAMQDEYWKRRYDEDIALRKRKREIGIPIAQIAAGIAAFIPLVLLPVMLICVPSLNEGSAGVVLVSASILSFVVIYSVIIRSTLDSPKQDEE